MPERDLIFRINDTYYEYRGPNPNDPYDMLLWAGPERSEHARCTGEVVSLHEELGQEIPLIEFMESIKEYRKGNIKADDFIRQLTRDEHKVRIIRE